MFQIYNCAGFEICKLHVGLEFKHLEDMMTDIDIKTNYCSAQEHVPELERSICVIKERFHVMYHHLPYQGLPKMMVRVGAMECVCWLNQFCSKGGVSEVYSPHVIMAGKSLEFDKHCFPAFGSYVQASNENNPTNMTTPDTLFGQSLTWL